MKILDPPLSTRLLYTFVFFFFVEGIEMRWFECNKAFYQIENELILFAFFTDGNMYDLQCIFSQPCMLTFDIAKWLARHHYTGWPIKKWTVDTVDFQDFALINSYLFSPCWIEHLFLIIITPRSYKRSFFVSACDNWNNLPFTVKESPSITSFKRNLNVL